MGHPVYCDGTFVLMETKACNQPDGSPCSPLMSNKIDFRVTLTEVDGDKVVFVEELLQHPPVDLLDLVPDLEDVLRSKPLEHTILVVQVSVKPGIKFRSCSSCPPERLENSQTGGSTLVQVHK